MFSHSLSHRVVLVSDSVNHSDEWIWQTDFCILFSSMQKYNTHSGIHYRVKEGKKKGETDTRVHTASHISDDAVVTKTFNSHPSPDVYVNTDFGDNFFPSSPLITKVLKFTHERKIVFTLLPLFALAKKPQPHERKRSSRSRTPAHQ